MTITSPTTVRRTAPRRCRAAIGRVGRRPRPRAAPHLGAVAARRAPGPGAAARARTPPGGDGWLFAGVDRARPDRARPPRRACRGTSSGWTGVTYDEARAGCYDGAARLADMDLDGVDAEVIFPPQRTDRPLPRRRGRRLRAGRHRRLQRLPVVEEFCAPDRTRLIGAAQMPSTGVDDAVEILQQGRRPRLQDGRDLELARRAASSSATTTTRFWAAAAEAGVPVCIHINLISRAARQRAREAAAAGREAAPLYGGDEGRGRGQGRDRPVRACSRWCRRVIGQLIFTGVFERYPGLHVSHDRDGRRLAAALPRADGRPLLAQPLAGPTCRSREPPSTYWYSQHVGHVHPRRQRPAQPPRGRRRQHDVVDRLPASRQRLALLAQGDRRDDGRAAGRRARPDRGRQRGAHLRPRRARRRNA